MNITIIREFFVQFIIGFWLVIFITACTDEQAPVGRMPPVLNLGEIAPDFTFQPLMEQGSILDKLTNHRGKVIYLDFWASWCKPCLKSMPMLNQLHSDLIESGFEVIAVNLDNNPANGKAFLMRFPVDYPVVRTTNEGIYELYQINGLPTAYLIDRQGVLRYSHQGFKGQDMDIIRQQIMLLIN